VKNEQQPTLLSPTLTNCRYYWQRIHNWGKS